MIFLLYYVEICCIEQLVLDSELAFEKYNIIFLQ